MNTPTGGARWDIFCRVIDHFGDAGVSFRLARQLVAEHGFAVTLWIDSPGALADMVPGFLPASAAQIAAGVTVRHWTDPLPAFAPADVVVNAFVAGLPDVYVDAMAARSPRAPRWIELEHLSPDPAFDVHHLQASPHPRLPLARTYWVPGFSVRAGGLLRERGLLDRRDRFAADIRAQAEFRRLAGLPDLASSALKISMFSYAHAPAAPLAHALRNGPMHAVCAMPSGDPFGGNAAIDFAQDRVAGNLAISPTTDPLPRAFGQLTAITYPFLPQDDFDRLLWTCDVNFVRGEDSFVRALWAGKPLVWLVYPQEHDVQDRRLGAFLDWYTTGLGERAARAYREMTLAWNWRQHRGPRSARAVPDVEPSTPGAGIDASPWPIEDAWRSFVAALAELRAHAARKAELLAHEPDLVSRLVKYVETCL